ncbi:unnamed protein product [Victoria cruziana]
MAEGEAKARLMSLVRDVASERSQGERRVSILKKRLSELQAELDAHNCALEEAKCTKEVVEKELRASEFALELVEISIDAYKARVSSQLEKISKLQSESQLLKKEEALARDAFLEEMVQFNEKIRKAQKSYEACLDQRSLEGEKFEVSDVEEDKKMEKETIGETDADTEDREKNLAYVKNKMEDARTELERDQAIHNQVTQKIANFQKRLALMEAITGETKELQSLSRYPFCLQIQKSM